MIQEAWGSGLKDDVAWGVKTALARKDTARDAAGVITREKPTWNENDMMLNVTPPLHQAGAECQLPGGTRLCIDQSPQLSPNTPFCLPSCTPSPLSLPPSQHVNQHNKAHGSTTSATAAPDVRRTKEEPVEWPDAACKQQDGVVSVAMKTPVSPPSNAPSDNARGALEWQGDDWLGVDLDLGMDDGAEDDFFAAADVYSTDDDTCHDDADDEERGAEAEERNHEGGFLESHGGSCGEIRELRRSRDDIQGHGKSEGVCRRGAGEALVESHDTRQAAHLQLPWHDDVEVTVRESTQTDSATASVATFDASAPACCADINVDNDPGVTIVPSVGLLTLPSSVTPLPANAPCFRNEGLSPLLDTKGGDIVTSNVSDKVEHRAVCWADGLEHSTTEDWIRGEYCLKCGLVLRSAHEILVRSENCEQVCRDE